MIFLHSDPPLAEQVAINSGIAETAMGDFLKAGEKEPWKPEIGKRLNLSSERLWKLCQEGIPDSHPRSFAYYAEKLLKENSRLCAGWDKTRNSWRRRKSGGLPGTMGSPAD